MPNSFSVLPIERLKREAKLLCRDSSLTHSDALNQIAQAHGYANWSLLMKHCTPPTAIATAASPVPFEFLRTPDEMRQALRVIPYHRYGTRQDELVRHEVDDICQRFISAANAVDFAVQYMTCLLQSPRLRFNAGAKVYHEMRRWLPYYVQPCRDDLSILVNRHYKPVGMTSSDWVDYIKFSHLRLQLDASQLEKFAHFGSGPGYLFHDGNSPWWDRKAATAYLKRLLVLQSLLNQNK